MAIKGKSRTKSKPKPVARAPKPVPVQVRSAFFLRRWVQVVLAFIAGVLAIVVLVWATDGVRQQNLDKKKTAQASSARRAVATWQSTVEGALSRLGPPSQGGAPPTLFSGLSGTIDSIRKGTVPPDTATTAQQAQDQSKTASDAIGQTPAATLIADKGLNAEQATWVVGSQTKIVNALELYGEAAALTADAAASIDDAQRKELATRAGAVGDLAARIFADGWTDYQQALTSVGIFPTGGGIPGGVGSTGFGSGS